MTAELGFHCRTLPSAEQGMKTNCCLDWCTHQTVGPPNVVQSLCSSGFQVLLSLDRQPRVRALLWNLHGTCLLCSGLIAAPGLLEQQAALANSPFSAHKNSTWRSNFPLGAFSFHSHCLAWNFYPAVFHHSHAWGCFFSPGCHRGQHLTGYRVPGARQAAGSCPLPTPAVGNVGEKVALLKPNSFCPSPSGSGKSSGPHPAWTESWITWGLLSNGCKQTVEKCCIVHQILKDTPASFSLSLMDSWVKGAALSLFLAPACCLHAAAGIQKGMDQEAMLEPHSRGRATEWRERKNIKVVVASHPNTAGSSPQSALILRRPSEVVEMTTFWECLLALVLRQ